MKYHPAESGMLKIGPNTSIYIYIYLHSACFTYRIAFRYSNTINVSMFLVNSAITLYVLCCVMVLNSLWIQISQHTLLLNSSVLVHCSGGDLS